MTITITAFRRMTVAQIRAGLPITVITSGNVLFRATADSPSSTTTTTQTPTTTTTTQTTTTPQITSVSKPHWLGNWSGNVQDTVRNIVSQYDTSLLVAYNIPGRDNGNYSAGGLASAAEYKSWVTQIANGIGSKKAIVVLEPDALGLSRGLNSTQQAERYVMLNEAIKALKVNANTKVYIDSSIWAGIDDSVVLLKKLTGMDGFTCNVSGYVDLNACIAYAGKVSVATGLSYIVDTSRNGYGEPHPGKWCNQTDTKVGTPNIMDPLPNCDAYLWVKVPGESDGLGINDDGSNPRGDVPSAGTMWPEFRDAIYSGNWVEFKRKYGIQ